LFIDEYSIFDKRKTIFFLFLIRGVMFIEKKRCLVFVQIFYTHMIVMILDKEALSF